MNIRVPGTEQMKTTYVGVFRGWETQYQPAQSFKILSLPFKSGTQGNISGEL